jgi:hypothetical protein
VELLNSDCFGVGKRKRGGEGIDGAAPTWERRGKRLVGGLEVAGCSSRLGDDGSDGCCPSLRKEKIPWASAGPMGR